MILVIGGQAQGKREYLRQTLGLSGEQIGDCASLPFSDLPSYPGWYKLNDLVARLLQQFPPQQVPDQVLHLALQGDLSRLVIVCDEVGCGIVPIEKTQREYRETVGRCCCALVPYTQQVVRIFCTIPTVLRSVSAAVEPSEPADRHAMTLER